MAALDRFVLSRSAQAIALLWGFAEATLFFLVPDVWLTLLACRSLRAALRGTFVALAGALSGGALMYALERIAPTAGRSALEWVPAIRPALIAKVHAQIDQWGLLALMLGPMKGIPYKIYAVDWAARGGSLFGFLLISVPARYIRFLLTALAARAMARILDPLTGHRVAIELTLYILFWVAFYIFYFLRLGW